MSKKKVAPPETWSSRIGPIIVEEVPSRQGGIYLRWWNQKRGQWDKKSLGNNKLGLPLRVDGVLDQKVIEWAKAEGSKQHLILTGNAAPDAEAKRPFAIGETWAAISDVEKGKYPHATAFRDELEKAIEYAVTVWGKDRAWATIEEDDWTTLMRRRLTDLVARRHRGLRTTEITVSRLVTTIRWLRNTKRIPAGAAEPPTDWKVNLATFWKGLTKSTRDYQPHRPRFTQDEALAILAVSWRVDPRFGLLLDVGAEYRLGQVARARRSDLDRIEGTLKVHGAGKKGGETIELTDAQLDSVAQAIEGDGYLAGRETAWLADQTDYDLFPGGKLVRWRVSGRAKGSTSPVLGKGASEPVAADTVRKWFRRAESLARVDTPDGKKPIKHVLGRGAYGIRREHVKVINDEGISRFGLRAGGGWSSTKIPDEIYDEQDNRRGRTEAKAARSKWRREGQPTAPVQASADEATSADTVRTSYAPAEITVNDPAQSNEPYSPEPTE